MGEKTSKTADVSRREEILQIAAETFAKKGFRASTTREIAERAGLLSGSLYYHFASKDEMAVEVVEVYFTELLEAYREAVASSTDAAEQMRALVRASLRVSHRRLNEVLILYQDWHLLTASHRDLAARMDEMERIWVDVVAAGVRAGRFRADIDPRLVYRAIMGAISWEPRWYRPGGQYSVDEVAAGFAEFFALGLIAESSVAPDGNGSSAAA